MDGLGIVNMLDLIIMMVDIRIDRHVYDGCYDDIHTHITSSAAGTDVLHAVESSWL